MSVTDAAQAHTRLMSQFATSIFPPQIIQMLLLLLPNKKDEKISSKPTSTNTNSHVHILIYVVDTSQNNLQYLVFVAVSGPSCMHIPFSNRVEKTSQNIIMYKSFGDSRRDKFEIWYFVALHWSWPELEIKIRHNIPKFNCAFIHSNKQYLHEFIIRFCEYFSFFSQQKNKKQTKIIPSDRWGIFTIFHFIRNP